MYFCLFYLQVFLNLQQNITEKICSLEKCCDSNLGFKLVQIRRNKYNIRESFIQELIYKFYSHNSRCCIKYIVFVKEYDDGLLTMDYYPKIKLTPKINSRDSIQDLRYRMLTRQNSFGPLGGTILDIMVDIR